MNRQRKWIRSWGVAAAAAGTVVLAVQALVAQPPPRPRVSVVPPPVVERAVPPVDRIVDPPIVERIIEAPPARPVIEAPLAPPVIVEERVRVRPRLTPPRAPVATEVFRGEVVGAGNARLTVTRDGQTRITYHITPNTRLLLGEREVRLADLRPGDIVRVVSQRNDPLAPVEVIAERVVGEPPAPAVVTLPAVPEQGSLGVAVAPSPHGVLVVDVQTRSPAERVGLRPGDFILSVNGVQSATPEGFLTEIQQTPADETVKATVWREGEAFDMAVVLGSRMDFPDVVQTRVRLPQEEAVVWMAQEFGFAARTTDQGVELIDVEPGSRADEAGLREGDVLLGVDGEEVATVDELHETIAARRPGDEVEFEILRDREVETFAMTLEPRPELAAADVAEQRRHVVRRMEADEFQPDQIDRRREEPQTMPHAAPLDELLHEVRALREEIEALRRELGQPGPQALDEPPAQPDDRETPPPVPAPEPVPEREDAPRDTETERPEE